jgi:hypothetical protein
MRRTTFEPRTRPQGLAPRQYKLSGVSGGSSGSLFGQCGLLVTTPPLTCPEEQAHQFVLKPKRSYELFLQYTVNCWASLDS